MANKRPTSRAERKAKTPATLPDQFVVKFWDAADKRQVVVKEIIRRYELLKADCGADSYQKDLLCQRAVFMAVQLESMEITAVQDGIFSDGVYTQMSNALLGLLKTLGLEKKISDVVNLNEYVQGNGK